MIHLANNPLILNLAPERFEFNLEISCLSKRTSAAATNQRDLNLT